MQQNKHNYDHEANEKFICLLTEEAEDRLRCVKSMSELLCLGTEYNDKQYQGTNKQIFHFTEMICREIDFILANSFYPGGLIDKRNIANKC
ncbi:hypothetical protein MKI77_004146 [Escherichia coli]|nr:hypothetical protein [Escherichia coli]